MDMEARCKRIYDEFLTRTEPRIRELEAEIDNWESLAERAEFRLDRLQRSAAGLDEDKEMAVMDEIARYEMFAKQASQALNDFHIYNDYRAHLESNVESLQSLLEDNRTDWLRVERRLERKGLTDEERAALTEKNESIKAVGAELLAEYDAFNEEWRRYDESLEEPEPDYNLVRAMIGNPGRDI
jgi:chromosome segregation ATPase